MAPTRKQFYTIPSDEVMGPGSFVRVKPTTQAESKALQAQIEGKSEEEKADINTAFIAAKILEWNWVDDNGDPLPLPKDDPDVIERLNVFEIGFIGRAMAGNIDQKK